jgi:formate dehydrogenase iron-sulfur subunit
MALQSLDITRRSATTTPSPSVRRTVEVAKLIDVTTCIGCKACQAACLEWNDIRDDVGANKGVYDNPPDLTASSWTVMRYSERKEGNMLEWLIRKDGCMHCQDPGCLKACPAPGAIIQYANGIVDFHEENCIGCGYCITGCPFNIPRLSASDSKVYKCTLCSDRVAAGMEPACIKSCPTGALQFGTKEQMHEYARERISDLRGRGFAKAGLYDPEGVGGTHVMYVLHHAEQPELYSGLVADPTIGPLVTLWKGFAKPVAIAALGSVALGSLVHYLAKGPNEVPKELEKEMEKEGDDI